MNQGESLAFERGIMNMCVLSYVFQVENGGNQSTRTLGGDDHEHVCVLSP